MYGIKITTIVLTFYYNINWWTSNFNVQNNLHTVHIKTAEPMSAQYYLKLYKQTTTV